MFTFKFPSYFSILSVNTIAPKLFSQVVNFEVGQCIILLVDHLWTINNRVYTTTHLNIM